ncbi:hypothetical protein F2P81_005950 [Scophthalmus maximus]|uniref:Uncharacterized protein n=1 Tax=Scophthalmus maximus TaxID=52904 RepID=A0A6A4TDE8_SCOMX|nr:hypothetical protein F2P81_005950 [Scophthalmus maximus]
MLFSWRSSTGIDVCEWLVVSRVVNTAQRLVFSSHVQLFSGMKPWDGALPCAQPSQRKKHHIDTKCLTVHLLLPSCTAFQKHKSEVENPSKQISFLN